MTWVLSTCFQSYSSACPSWFVHKVVWGWPFPRLQSETKRSRAVLFVGCFARSYTSATVDEIADFGESVGLDFVHFSEHNTVSTSTFLVDAQPRHPNVLMLPGVEWTSYSGHAGPLLGLLPVSVIRFTPTRACVIPTSTAALLRHCSRK